MLTDGRELVWRRSFFGTNGTCAFCGLLPLDDEDCETECAAVECANCGCGGEDLHDDADYPGSCAWHAAEYGGEPFPWEPVPAVTA